MVDGYINYLYVKYDNDTWCNNQSYHWRGDCIIESITQQHREHVLP